MYILLSGNSFITTAVGSGAQASVLLSPGDCVGQSAISLMLYHPDSKEQSMDESREATVTVRGECTFAQLGRADYLRVMGLRVKDAVEVLSSEVGVSRSAADVKIVHSLVQDVPFIARLHYTKLQRECCRHMCIRTLEPGDTLRLYAGEESGGGTFYIILEGSMQRRTAEHEPEPLERMYSFGEDELVPSEAADDAEESEEMCSFTATTECVLATLSRSSYLQYVRSAELLCIRILKKPCNVRTEAHLRLLMDFLSNQAVPFYEGLGLAGIRRQAVMCMNLEKQRAGAKVSMQGDVARSVFFILRGKARVIVNQATVRHASDGDSFLNDSFSPVPAEECLLEETVIAETDVLLVRIAIDDYVRIIQMRSGPPRAVVSHS